MIVLVDWLWLQSTHWRTQGARDHAPSPKRPTIFFAKKNKFQENWPCPRVVIMQKAFSFRGLRPSDPPDHGLCPWSPVGALPPRYRFALHAHHLPPPLRKLCPWMGQREYMHVLCSVIAVLFSADSGGETQHRAGWNQVSEMLHNKHANSCLVRTPRLTFCLYFCLICWC